MLVEQLGSSLKELKSLENAGSVDEAQTTLDKLLAAQEHEQKEMEEQIAEEGRHLQHFQVDCQRLIGDSKESKIIVQSVEQVIATAQATIARTQVLSRPMSRSLSLLEKGWRSWKLPRHRLKKTSMLIPPDWSLFKRNWLRRDFCLRRSCGSKLWWRLKEHVSTRCIASGNKSVL